MRAHGSRCGSRRCRDHFPDHDQIGRRPAPRSMPASMDVVRSTRLREGFQFGQSRFKTPPRRPLRLFFPHQIFQLLAKRGTDFAVLPWRPHPACVLDRRLRKFTAQHICAMVSPAPPSETQSNRRAVAAGAGSRRLHAPASSPASKQAFDDWFGNRTVDPHAAHLIMRAGRYFHAIVQQIESVTRRSASTIPGISPSENLPRGDSRLGRFHEPATPCPAARFQDKLDRGSRRGWRVPACWIVSAP